MPWSWKDAKSGFSTSDPSSKTQNITAPTHGPPALIVDPDEPAYFGQCSAPCGNCMSGLALAVVRSRMVEWWRRVQLEPRPVLTGPEACRAPALINGDQPTANSPSKDPRRMCRRNFRACALRCFERGPISTPPRLPRGTTDTIPSLPTYLIIPVPTLPRRHIQRPLACLL